MIDYTQEEEVKLEKFKKLDRPEIYKASEKQEFKISEDFENWLILEKKTTKDLLWRLLKQEVQKEDLTLEEELHQQAYNSLAEIKSKVVTENSNYMEFKKQLDPRWYRVDELGLLLKYFDRSFQQYTQRSTDWLEHIGKITLNYFKSRDDTESIETQNNSFEEVLKDYE